MDVYTATIRFEPGALPCPKVVYGRKAKTYTIWLYPTQLGAHPNW